DRGVPRRVACRRWVDAAGAGRVLDGVSEVRLLRRYHVPSLLVFRRVVFLSLRVGELRDRDGGQNADDHHHDQQLNEREALAIHATPCANRLPMGQNLPGQIRARAVPTLAPATITPFLLSS